MKAITVEALSKTFSGGTVAVDGIRFLLNQGEIFGFLGPNGAGKTTTVKLLCGMLTPSRGKCQVLGIDPTQNPEQLHEKVGVVTEHAQMYDHMTAFVLSALYFIFLDPLCRFLGSDESLLPYSVFLPHDHFYGDPGAGAAADL